MHTHAKTLRRTVQENTHTDTHKYRYRVQGMLRGIREIISSFTSARGRGNHTQNHKYKNTYAHSVYTSCSICHPPLLSGGKNKSITAKILHFKSATESHMRKYTHTWQHTFIKSVSTFAFTFWFGNLNGKCGASLHQMLMFQMRRKVIYFSKQLYL